MPGKKYTIQLPHEERELLLQMTSRGLIKARQFKRAMILLKADQDLADAEITAALNVSRSSVERIRKRYVTGGLRTALHENPRPGQKRKIDERAAALLYQLTASAPPEGYSRWTLRLLADKLVELGVVDKITPETVRRVLKK
ncbi:MAG: helix-turn-helix domain-containing protein [Anaerolineales bacterium]|nr:helix-turn-helix domain-containing protein [Anaerolineales bacterium]